MTHTRTILLINSRIENFRNLTLTLEQIGYNILFAKDGREGFRLIRRELPDLVISDVNISAISALELCRMVREDRELWATPMIFVSDLRIENNKLIEMLDAGADECLSQFSDSQYLASKADWLIKRKTSENYLIHNYEIMRGKQKHIAEIIKGTANLFSMSKLEQKNLPASEIGNSEFGKNLNQRIDLGMNMICSLANLLEEQIDSLETWKQIRRKEDRSLSKDNKNSELYFECIDYSVMKDSLSAN